MATRTNGTWNGDLLRVTLDVSERPGCNAAGRVVVELDFGQLEGWARAAIRNRSGKSVLGSGAITFKRTVRR